jgi:hypothetical protein
MHDLGVCSGRQDAALYGRLGSLPPRRFGIWVQSAIEEFLYKFPGSGVYPLKP